MKGLEAIRTACIDCQECPLATFRDQQKHKVVFGEGPADARVVFVGERPGELEGKTGRPMLGPIGRFFDKMLEKVGIDRKEVFITNAVMCYPPEGREATAQELKACKRWLNQVLYAIDPVLIMAMGAAAVDVLADLEGQVTHNYGQILLGEIPGELTPVKIPVGVLANPAFVRRQNDFGASSHAHWEMWALQNLMREADILSHEWFGDPLRERGTINLRKPDRIIEFPRVLPDDWDDDEYLEDYVDDEYEEGGVPENSDKP